MLAKSSGLMARMVLALRDRLDELAALRGVPAPAAAAAVLGGAGVELVSAAAAGENVGGSAAGEAVTAGSAGQYVLSPGTDQGVHACGPVEHVRSAASDDPVVAGAAAERPAHPAGEVADVDVDQPAPVEGIVAPTEVTEDHGDEARVAAHLGRAVLDALAAGGRRRVGEPLGGAQRQA